MRNDPIRQGRHFHEIGYEPPSLLDPAIHPQLPRPPGVVPVKPVKAPTEELVGSARRVDPKLKPRWPRPVLRPILRRN